MRILKSHPLLKMVNSYVVDSPQPSNISYLWNFGSLLAFCLIIQIVTGVTLGMHYTPNVLEAFDSVEHIMRDVNNGWLIRYLHSNTASAFFFLVYLHIGRGLYYASYKAPRTLTWIIGTIILILMMATAFLGYFHSPKWYELFLNLLTDFNHNFFIYLYIIFFFLSTLLLFFPVGSNMTKQLDLFKTHANNTHKLNISIRLNGKRYYSTNRDKFYKRKYYSTNNNNNNSKKKTILQRIWLGIKLAWNLPSLPTYVEKFHNYPLTRIFRVIGGVSIILFLSSNWIEKDSYLYWIILILAMLHFSYIFTISLIKLGYIIHLWKNKKLEVRNSPLDHIASLTLKLATCIKGACVAGGAGATVLGLGFGGR